jgi:hypothetical protein
VGLLSLQSIALYVRFNLRVCELMAAWWWSCCCHQGLAVSTLLYKSAAVESRENGIISPSERGRSEGLSALQNISASLVKQSANIPLDVGRESRRAVVAGVAYM